jgi:diacylglycerol kinase (ATP)
MKPSRIPSLKPEPKTPAFRVARRSGLWGSFRHAWAGLIHTVVHQPNMRIHLGAAYLVSLVGSGIPLGLAEKVTLIFCVLLVFFAEILNSALEQLVDLATEQLHAKAKIAKDAAAAGVLVLAIGTVVIFAALVFHNLETILAFEQSIYRQIALGLPLTFCGVALISSTPRPLWADILAFATGLGLVAAIAWRSQSAVFSAMALGLLVVSGAAALERRKNPPRK